MKKLLILTAILFTVTVSKSQTIEDAKKQIYYDRYESAAKILQSVIASGNASPDAWYWLGEVYLAQHKMDLAKETFKAGEAIALTKDKPKKEYPLVFIGTVQTNMNTETAETIKAQFEGILEESRFKNPDALWAAAKANLDNKNGDIPWAIEMLLKARRRDKHNPLIYTTLGNAYRKQMDGANAIKYYDEALEEDPTFAEAMFRKGSIYKSQNNPEIYMDRFTKAYEIDSTYGPVLKEMYNYYYFRDVVTAKKYLDKYIQYSDPNPEQEYMKTDLAYVSKKYKEAIDGAKSIISATGDSAKPRMYKLLAYSYASLGDSAAALKNINIYFDKQDPKEFVVKDYLMKAKLLETIGPDKSSAIDWYKKALALQEDKNEKLSYMGSIADLQKKLGDREREAAWREQIYNSKDKATNLDIYKWGMALYSDGNYAKSDSVFKIYQERYPDQIYGYLWRARCNALIDTAMDKGLAVPLYIKLIEVASKDSVKNRAILLRAYEYLGGYEANITKNYVASLGYFDKLLQLDPDNGDARKNSEILAQWIAAGKGVNKP